MARNGKIVNFRENPLYWVDENNGEWKIPTYNGKGLVILRSLKQINRDAFDNCIFEIEVKGEKVRLHLDEVREGLRYV